MPSALSRLRSSRTLRYLGPGLLVTVGFIDPGNWASNVAAGSTYGYSLLWMVTLSTIMLILLQHNAAHLGISTGLCLSEAATRFLHPLAGRTVVLSAMVAAAATALAEILGGAIALNMLLGLPVKAGALLTAALVTAMVFSNTYPKIEKIIIAFVSLIGLSFLAELFLVDIEWRHAATCWVTPVFPTGSMLVIMSVLGAVVMPHNLFLHSEIIQSREWNLQDRAVRKRQLRYEFLDTLFSMIVGWGINSAMILLAAAAFFSTGTPVTTLEQAQAMLVPAAGKAAALLFALALLFSGFASSVTAGMAGGSIAAGLAGQGYDIRKRPTFLGVLFTTIVALCAIFFISNPFRGLIMSQVLLSLQLPWTVFLLIYLTSSKRVMGEDANHGVEKILLFAVAAVVAALNVMLLISMLK
ncbi:MAG: Nramp family divalent metal transporter [Fibrobacterota bacterium]